MAIQLSRTSCSNLDIERKILDNFDLKTSLKCGSVCKLWNMITSEDSFLLPKLDPEISILFECNIKECLSRRVVLSEDEIMVSFKELIEKTEPFGSFSFRCIFPYNPDNIFFVKRQPSILNDDGVVVGVEKDYSFDHKDFCVLMKPITSKYEREAKSRGYPPHHFEYCISGNYNENRSISENMYAIIGQHDYPNTWVITENVSTIKYTCLNTFWSIHWTICDFIDNAIPPDLRPIAAGAAVIGATALGALACYKYFQK